MLFTATTQKNKITGLMQQRGTYSTPTSHADESDESFPPIVYLGKRAQGNYPPLDTM